MELPPEVVIAERDPAFHFGPRYVLVEQVGEGGLGTVWKSWDRHLEKFVAIKRIRGAFDAAEVEAFLTEGRVIARLQHPHITPVFDVGVHEGVPFIIMQFVDGPTLGRAPHVDPIPLLRDAATAIAHAHRLGILHQDLKPENLMVDAEGRVQVLDFGVTRTLGGSLRRSGRIGTPGFMSPEQESGAPVDERTDVYGWGATLRAVVPKPSPRVKRVIERCLDPDPARRFPNLREASAALGRATSRRFEAGIAAIALFLAAALSIGAAPKVKAWVEARRESAAIGEAAGLEAAGRLEEAHAALGRAGARGRTLRAELALSLGGHEAVWEVRGHGSGVTGVAFCANGRRVASAGRDSRIRFLDAATGALLTEAKSHDGLVTALDADPGGTIVATGGDDRMVRLWNGGTGAPIREWLAHEATVTRVRFSPDGSTLATGAVDGSLRLWAVSGGAPRNLKGLTGGVRSLAFSADGAHLAAGGEEDRIFVWDLRAGTSRTLPAHLTWTRALAFSPDGAFLVAGFAGNILKRYDLATGAVSLEWKGHGNFLAEVRICDGGSLALTASGDGTVRYWNCATGEPVATLPQHSDEVLSMAVREGRVLTGCLDGTVRLSERRWRFERLGRFENPEYLLHLLPDGRAIGFQGGEAYIAGPGERTLLFRLAAPDADVRPIRPEDPMAGFLIFRLDGSGPEPIHVVEEAQRIDGAWKITPVARNAGWGLRAAVASDGRAHAIFQGPIDRLQYAVKDAGKWSIRDLGPVKAWSGSDDLVPNPSGGVDLIVLTRDAKSLIAHPIDANLPGLLERESDPAGLGRLKAWRDPEGRLHGVASSRLKPDVIKIIGSGFRRFLVPEENVAAASGAGSLDTIWVTLPDGLCRRGRCRDLR